LYALWTRRSRIASATGGACLDVFDARFGQSQVSLSETILEPAIVAGDVLDLDEQPEALVEAEVGDAGIRALLLPGRGHRAKTHGVEFVQGGFSHHVGRSFSLGVS
jgi:hypothetical protein